VNDATLLMIGNRAEQLETPIDKDEKSAQSRWNVD
jgi:hypothetical protein